MNMFSLEIQDRIYEYVIESTEQYVQYYGGNSKYWKYFTKDLKKVLYYACEFNHSNFIHFLLGKLDDYDVNQCLLFSAKGGNLELIHFFIKKGANHWTLGALGAVQGGHLILLEFFSLKAEHYNLIDWNFLLSNIPSDVNNSILNYLKSKIENL